MAQLVSGRSVYKDTMERVTAEDESVLEVEQGQVRSWRREQFVRLGFSEAQALLLADSDADLGQARYLLNRGCSSALALQILL